MKFKGKNSQIELTIIGYEFEQATIHEDKNWLNIKIDVKDNSKKWTAHGPYITTSEIGILKDFFQSLQVKKELRKEKTISFWENEIAFKYNPDANELLIILDFDFHYKGKEYDHESDSEYVMAFVIDDKIVSKSIQQLNEIQSKFPVR